MSSDPDRPTPRRHRADVVRILRYVLVGAVGSGATAVFYLVLRTWLDPLPANLVALLLSTLLSTELNRRFTFGGAPAHPWRTVLQIAGTVTFYAFYNSAVLMLVVTLVANPSPVLEASALVVASVLGGVLRYLAMRFWEFDTTAADQEAAPPDAPASGLVPHWTGPRR